MRAFTFTAEAKRRHRPSLTPMIDVVFLLLVFFMLAARFGIDQVMPLSQTGTSAGYSGAPRLIDISPTATLLNGERIEVERLPAALKRLMPNTDAQIVLRSQGNATVQHVIDIADALARAGFGNLVLVK